MNLKRNKFFKLTPYTLPTCFFFVSYSYAQSLTPTPPQLEELFQRTYGFLSASKYCQDKLSFDRSNLSLKRIIDYARTKGMELKSIKIFLNDPAGMINKGAKLYGEQHWISCAEVDHYSKVVEDLVKKF